MRARILVTGARDSDVLGHDLVALPLELLRQHLLERPALDADEAQDCGDGRGVVVQRRRRQLRQGKRAELHAFRGAFGLQLALIEEDRRAWAHPPHVAVHRVLVERNQHVQLVAHAAHGRLAGPDGQEGVPAPDDRLVGVVGVDVQPAPHEQLGENGAGRGHALAGRPADPDRKIALRHGRRRWAARPRPPAEFWCF